MSKNDNENNIPENVSNVEDTVESHPPASEPEAAQTVTPVNNVASDEVTSNSTPSTVSMETTPPPPPEELAPAIDSHTPDQENTVSLDKEQGTPAGQSPAEEYPTPPRDPYYVALERQQQEEEKERQRNHVPPHMTPPPYDPSGQVPPAYSPPPYAPAGPPPPAKPKNLETAYAYLFFLGLFGGHKFYMGQNNLGNIYLIVGLVFTVFIGLPIIGSFFGFFIFGGLLANLYADIRTMREQLERSARGEEFTFDTQTEFFAKAFSVSK